MPFTDDAVEDAEQIDVGGPTIAGLRSPRLREFRIEW